MIITVAAGKSREVRIVGRYFRCRESSHAFDLKVDSDTYTLEGGDEFSVRDDDADFIKLMFSNRSATEELTVDFFAGKNIVRNAYVKLPRTEIFGREVDALADHGTQDFPGVVDGKRRKQFTITVAAGIGGKILLYNTDNDELLAIVAGNATAGVGFAIETDCNLTMKNETSTPIQSTSATDPEIAVAETFYR